MKFLLNAISQTSPLSFWPGQPYLVLLTPSLLIVVEDIVTYVVFRFPDKQTCSFLDMVASPAGGQRHSQEEQHCNQTGRNHQVLIICLPGYRAVRYN